MRSRWMTFSIALAVALMLALPVVGFAQNTRVEGNARQGDNIKDYTGIYTYPSCLSQVGNLMYAELGNNGSGTTTNPSNGGPLTFDRSVGTVMDKLFDGRWGIWGLHLRQETPQLGQGDAFSQPGAGFGGADPNHNTNEAFDLMWAHKSGTTTIGLRLHRSNMAFKDEVPGVTTNLKFDQNVAFAVGSLARNLMGYGAGIGFEMGPQSQVEIAAEYQSRTWENSVTGGNKWTDNGPTTFAVAARMFRQWKPNVMLVPVVKYTTYDLSDKFDNTLTGGALTTYDNSLRSWQVGVSSDWTLGTNDLMVWGVTFAQNHLEQQEDLFGLAAAAGMGAFDNIHATESLFPQIFAALETHVNSWLTLRFGANKGAFQSVKIEDKTAGATETQTLSFSSFQMHIGAGVKVGQLQLDAVLADNLPQNMGWLGSGIAQSYFPKVTATYPF